MKASIEKILEIESDEYTFLDDRILKEDKMGEWNIIDYADDDLQESVVQGEFFCVDFPTSKG